MRSAVPLVVVLVFASVTIAELVGAEKVYGSARRTTIQAVSSGVLARVAFDDLAGLTNVSYDTMQNMFDFIATADANIARKFLFVCVVRLATGGGETFTGSELTAISTNAAGGEVAEINESQVTFASTQVTHTVTGMVSAANNLAFRVLVSTATAGSADIQHASVILWEPY